MRSSLSVLIAVAGCSLEAQAPPAAPNALAAAIAWFDTLAHPAYAERPFVRACTGWWSAPFDGEPSNTLLEGFLLRDDGRTFRLLTLDLAEFDFIRTPAGTAPHRRVEYVVLDLGEFAASVLASDETVDVGGRCDWVHPQLSDPARAFVLARACMASGRAGAAARLAARAKSVWSRQGRSLRSALEEELGHVGWWRIVLGFGDAALSYQQLLAEVVAFEQQFPGHAHAKTVRETREILQRMLAEEAARPAPADLAALPQPQRIAELVHRLRDQNGLQPGQPARCDVFADPRKDASPAHRLLAEGLAAAPALAAAFDDDSLTRSVEYHRDFYFSHRVLRVGDVAQRVLYRLSGQWFADRAAAGAWAQELVAHGEVAARVHSVVEQASRGAAVRLLEIAPERLLDAVRQALAGQHPDGASAGLVAVLGGLPGADAEATLRERLLSGGPRARPRRRGRALPAGPPRTGGRGDGGAVERAVRSAAGRRDAGDARRAGTGRLRAGGDRQPVRHGGVRGAAARPRSRSAGDARWRPPAGCVATSQSHSRSGAARSQVVCALSPRSIGGEWRRRWPPAWLSWPPPERGSFWGHAAGAVPCCDRTPPSWSCCRSWPSYRPSNRRLRPCCRCWSRTCAPCRWVRPRSAR